MCNEIYSLKRFHAYDHCVNFLYQVWLLGRNNHMQCQESGLLYSVGDCVDCRPEYVASESRRVANQYRAQLQKSDRYSWILEDLLLNSVVQAESSDTELHDSLKEWNTRNLDENVNPQCIRTIY